MGNYVPNFIPKKTSFLVGQKAIVQNFSGKILILQRSKKAGGGDKWSLPGGGLEEGENLLESINREMIEETELKVTDFKQYSSRIYKNAEGELILIIGYLCESDTNEVKLNWEHKDYKWVSKGEALKFDLTEDGRYFIENFKE